MHTAFFNRESHLSKSVRLFSRGLGPHKGSLLCTHTLLDELEIREALPELAQEAGLLLDVVLAEQRGDGPGGLLCVVEGDTSAEN